MHENNYQEPDGYNEPPIGYSWIDANRDACWGDTCEAYFWDVTEVMQGKPCSQPCEFNYKGHCTGGITDDKYDDTL